jgi:O-antigen ligase
MPEKAAQSELLNKSPDSPRDSGPSLPDLAFGLLLFLTLTDLYRFIALWAGFTSLAPLTGVFALACIGYALRYWRYTCVPFSRLAGWTAFVLLVPLGSIAYSLNPNFRYAALQFFYMSLLWASKAFFSRSSTSSLRGLLLDAALIVGFAGVVLSIVNPGLFVAISQMTGDETPYFFGRAYGFYLQPNMCASSVTFLMFLWLFVRKPRGLLYSLLIITTYLLAILLTGSRGGMVTAAFLLSGYILFPGREWDWPVFGARIVRFSVLGGAGLVLLIGAVFELAPHLTPDGAVETLRRIKSLADYRDLAQADNSVRGRLESQQAYLAMMAERPLLGYGMGSAPVMRERGFLAHTSHNMFIEYGFMYGAVGLVVWLGVALMTWQDCFVLRRVLFHKIGLLFFGVMFLTCLTSNTVLAERVPYVVVGWLLANRGPYPQAFSAANTLTMDGY